MSLSDMPQIRTTVELLTRLRKGMSHKSTASASAPDGGHFSDGTAASSAGVKALEASSEVFSTFFAVLRACPLQHRRMAPIKKFFAGFQQVYEKLYLQVQVTRDHDGVQYTRN